MKRKYKHLKNFAKSDFAYIFVKFVIFAKIVIYLEPPDDVLYNDIYFVQILRV